MEFSSGNQVSDLLSGYMFLENSISNYNQSKELVITGKNEIFEKQLEYNL